MGTRESHLPDPGTAGRDPSEIRSRARGKCRGGWGSRGVPINCKLAPVHQQEVPSIHVPLGTGTSIGCSCGGSALTLSQPDPLCAGGGGFALDLPLLPLTGVPLPKACGTGTLTWVAPVPPAGRAVPPSLGPVFPTGTPLSVSLSVSVLPLVSVSSPVPVSLSLPAPAARHSLPGRGTRGGGRAPWAEPRAGLAGRGDVTGPAAPAGAKEGVTVTEPVPTPEQEGWWSGGKWAAGSAATSGDTEERVRTGCDV